MTSTFFCGLDLGQAADYSAFCALERIRGEGRPHYRCRALHRWPLGTSYPAIVQSVKDMLDGPLKDCTLAVDATGVGRPVVDLLCQEELPAYLQPVIITAGHNEGLSECRRYQHVAKVILISTVQILLQSRRLEFAAKLPETPTLIRELQGYRVKITPAANETFNAREGEHDDLVLALALACWAGERYPDLEISFGTDDTRNRSIISQAPEGVFLS